MKLKNFILVWIIVDVFMLGLFGGFVSFMVLPASTINKMVLSRIEVVRVLKAVWQHTVICDGYIEQSTDDSDEDCDAVFLEKGILASDNFLQELKPEMDDIKKVVETVIAGQPAVGTDDEYESSKSEYDESVRRYWVKSGQPKK